MSKLVENCIWHSLLGSTLLLLLTFSQVHGQSTTFFPPIDDTIVDAGELGRIRGSYSLLSRPRYGNRDYYYYYTGIPYADPASYTADNRFKPSTLHTGPLTNDSSVFIADKSLVWCPQSKLIDFPTPEKSGGEYNFTEMLRAANQRRQKIRQDPISAKGDGYMGQEDCLVVTVSTPNIQRVGDPEIDPSELLPVIVFYHGGGFNQFWGSVFGGHRLLNRDVVLVSLNYRLGILGSLNLGVDDAPGNALVYDAITALQWVQSYIKHFGGDPNRVTVSGQSAGAVLSTTVFLSPLSEGLIHRAIGDSGSAYSIWATNMSPMNDHVRFATFTSCNDIIDEAPSEEDIDFQLLTNCIKSLSLGDLVKAQEEFGAAENLEARMGYDAYVPSLQSPTITHPRCIVESPSDVLKNKRQANVPLMMGVTRHDGSFVFDVTYFDYLVANGLHLNQTFIRNDFLKNFLGAFGFVDTTGALLHSLIHTYVGDAMNSNDFNAQIPGILDIHTVLGFKAGGFGLVEQHSKLNPYSYYYAFDYKGMWSTYPIAAYSGTPVPGGVAHVDDLTYLFQLFPLISQEDIEVTKRYVDYWVNFATFGNPNGQGDVDAPFPKYSAADHKFLIINTTDSAGTWCRDSWVNNALELL